MTGVDKEPTAELPAADPVSALIEQKWNCKIGRFKMGESFKHVLLRGRQVMGFMDVVLDPSLYMLSNRDYEYPLWRYNGTFAIRTGLGLKAFLVVHCADGVFYHQTRDGMQPVVDDAPERGDVLPYVLIPVSEFKILGRV